MVIVSKNNNLNSIERCRVSENRPLRPIEMLGGEYGILFLFTARTDR